MKRRITPHGIPVVGPSGKPVAPQRNRDEWKAVRGPRIGSSDLAALLGHDEYVGPWEVWDRIVLGEWREGENADMRRGNRQEKNALLRFSEEFGLNTRAVGMIHHPADERIVSDLDALVYRPRQWPDPIMQNPLWDYIRLDCKGHGALEAKTPRLARFFQYRDEGMLVSHAIQMQHHLEVSGFTWGVLTFYCPEYDQSIAFPVIANEAIGKWIREEIPAWYRKYVDTRTRPMHPIPPPPVWPPKVPGIAKVRSDDAWMDEARLLAIRHYDLAEAQAAYAQQEEKLLGLLTEAPEDNHVTGGGVVVKRWQHPGQRRFDTKGFLARMKLAQGDGDMDALIALDPQDERFFYRTPPTKKVEVTVTGPNPLETT